MPDALLRGSQRINFRRSVVYGFGVLWTSVVYRLWKWKLARPSLVLRGRRAAPETGRRFRVDSARMLSARWRARCGSARMAVAHPRRAGVPRRRLAAAVSTAHADADRRRVARGAHADRLRRAGIATHFGYADHSIPLTLYYRWLYDLGILSEWQMHLPLLLAGIALLLIAPSLLRDRVPLAVRAVWMALLAVSPVSSISAAPRGLRARVPVRVRRDRRVRARMAAARAAVGRALRRDHCCGGGCIF